MFAVLHIGNFALQAVLRHERDIMQRPVALFDNSQKKSLVVACNAAAQATGVEVDMTAPQAIARCASLIVRTPDAAAEFEARAALLAVGFTFSPHIEATAPGHCTVDLKGLPPAQWLNLATSAIARLRGLGLATTVGIAHTPLLALYAARATSSVLQIENDREFLAPLPITAADPGPKLKQILASWGLRTLGEVTAISCEAFVLRFGAEGLAFWKRAAGGCSRPLKPVALPQKFIATMEFENEIETLEPLLFILRRFLDRLSLELQAAHFVANEIDFELTLEDDTCQARRFRLPEPTADPEILFRTLHTHLESLRTPSPIVSLELKLTPTRPLVRQQGLFEAGLRDPHGFAETLARAAALVGADQVGTPERDDTHRPDAVKLISPLSVIPPAVAVLVHPPLASPLHRYRPPLDAQVLLVNGVPTFLWAGRIQDEICRCSEVYRSSGEWWEAEREWSREECDIELTKGGLYRLVREDGNWFVEGEYD